jgi:hypothetical protein
VTDSFFNKDRARSLETVNPNTEKDKAYNASSLLTASFHAGKLVVQLLLNASTPLEKKEKERLD